MSDYKDYSEMSDTQMKSTDDFIKEAVECDSVIVLPDKSTENSLCARAEEIGYTIRRESIVIATDLVREPYLYGHKKPSVAVYDPMKVVSHVLSTEGVSIVGGTYEL